MNTELKYKITEQSSNLISQIMQEGKLLGTEKESFYKELVDNLLRNFVGKSGNDLFSLITEAIKDIQSQLNFYLNEILHDKTFLEIEASWNGVYQLVRESSTGSDLKIKILDISPNKLYNDLSRVMEFDQSALFKRIYEDEYGTFGGEPFSCIIFDYYITRSNKDFDFINRLSQICAASHVPAIVSAHPSMFDIKNMSDLNIPRDLSKIFESEELSSWNSFRSREESKYIILTLPRVLGRVPYNPETNPVEELEFFTEDASAENLLWKNAAFYLGLIIAKSYEEYGWMSAIRGSEGGGKVTELPIFRSRSLTGEISAQCPTEVIIPDRREKELSDLGFLPLCFCKNTDYAVFFGSQTAHKPKIYNKADANANSKISCRLSYLLNVCRFAHYIKSIMRDKIGQYADRQEVEIFLNNWIADYVILNKTTDANLLSRYPLSGAHVQVLNKPDNPGYYCAVIHMKPHTQLEGIDISLRLVAELPAKNT